MRFIGLTGGIATGKSTVASLLREHGAVVIDADQLAREVVFPGTPALAEIADAFGAGVLAGDGALDRAALAALVFTDPARRARLEAITHPRISALLADRAAAALGGPAPLVVAEIPLLFENRREAMFDGTMLVHVPAPVQLQRLVRRDRLEETAARQRLAAQLPIDDKRGRATWVIDNRGSPGETAALVDAWWRSTVAGSGGHPVDQQ